MSVLSWSRLGAGRGARGDARPVADLRDRAAGRAAQGGRGGEPGQHEVLDRLRWIALRGRRGADIGAATRVRSVQIRARMTTAEAGNRPGTGGCPAAQGSAGHRADGVLGRPVPTHRNEVNADMDRKMMPHVSLSSHQKIISHTSHPVIAVISPLGGYPGVV